MKPDHFDVLIVGAGLSGIGMACHLRRNFPNKKYGILEARQAIGGTWDLFRYPGIRADSDMYTLSYKFKPWRGKKEIADGDEILEYIKQTAAEYKVEDHIRFGIAVQRATWSTKDAMWSIEAKHAATGETVRLTCNMLLMCAGYYSYESGYTPEFPDQSSFQGQVVHPQDWPEQLDYSGKRVIVIGSGATAVSLVPVLAEQAGHVVMLQRSPTYMLARAEVSRLGVLRKFLPRRVSHAIGRWWNLKMSHYFYRLSREKPEKARRFLLRGVRQQLGPDYDVEKHFSPSYDPWDQRLCLVRNGDLFSAVKSGKVTMVTQQVARFTKNGVLLQSGEELPADLIVTATGLAMKLLGGMEIVVDGLSLDLSKTFTYKGMMISDVPNLVSIFGYVNASWTLRADLIAEFTCRLIQFMDQNKLRQCTPRLRESDHDMTTRPFIDVFSSNYIQRAVHLMPMQGDREPWVNDQDYKRDASTVFSGPVDDGCLVFDQKG